jgi:transposase
MNFVGLDVHWKTSTYCILNNNGKKIKTQVVKGGWDMLLHMLRSDRDLTGRWSVCFEASCGYGALYEKLKRLACKVTVAHPGLVRLIFKSKKKNDRIDAEKLAKLLYLDEVPRAYVPKQEIRDWRKMIEFRCSLVNKRVAIKNSIRSLLRGHGIQMPKYLWTLKGLAWLKEIELPSSQAELQRDMLLADLNHASKQVKRVTVELDRRADSDPGVTLAKTVPGIGNRTAETLVAYIDDPKRFGRNCAIGSYFGLVPCQDASANKNRLGHITKDGPATARKYLCEATWKAIRGDTTVRKRFEQFSHGKKDRRKIALVATAHWLLRCILSMMQTGEVWRQAA